MGWVESRPWNAFNFITDDETGSWYRVKRDVRIGSTRWWELKVNCAAARRWLSATIVSGSTSRRENAMGKREFFWCTRKLVYPRASAKERLRISQHADHGLQTLKELRIKREFRKRRTLESTDSAIRSMNFILIRNFPCFPIPRREIRCEIDAEGNIPKKAKTIIFSLSQILLHPATLTRTRGVRKWKIWGKVERKSRERHF